MPPSDDTPPPRDTLRLAVALGAAAAIIGSTILVSGRKDPSFTAWALVSGPMLFAACFIAAYATRRGGLVLLGAVFGGVFLGYVIHVMIHTTFFNGGRNLWPFEAALFIGFGFVPAVVGVLLGRRLRHRQA